MLKKTFLVFTYACVLSCTAFAQQPQEEFNPEVKKFTYTTNSAIVIKTYDEGFDHDVVTGNKVVLQYFYKAKDYVHVADDEYSEYIRFEIPANAKSFKFTNQELANANVIFNRGCFCPETGNYRITKGTIKGKRKGCKTKVYLVDIDIVVEPRNANGGMVPVEKRIIGKFIAGNLNLE
jgi:hypothetical protein